MINMARKVQYGIGSIVRKGWHVPMFDLDNTSQIFTESFAQYLQKKYKLGNAYIIKSSKYCFHLMFTDVVRESEWMQIQLEGFPKEKKHLGWALLRGFAVLRVSEKEGSIPFLLNIIKHKTKRKQSYNHQAFLATYYKNSGLLLPKKKYELMFHSYSTW